MFNHVPVLLLLASVLTSLIESRKTFALIVSSSRYWPNYRDKTNIAFFYNTVKSLGVPDRRIISMFSDEIQCHPRNPFPGLLYDNNPRLASPVSPGRVTVRGNEVSRENFFRILHQRHAPFTPRYRRLEVDSESQIFVYFTGHSAVGYTKFQDYEDVDANDIAHAIEHLWRAASYSQLLWIGDTCRAASIHNAFYSPNITAIGSSNEIDKSYSMPTVIEIGESVIDRFTYISKEAFQTLKTSDLTIGEYMGNMDPVWMGAQVTHRVTEAGVGLGGKLVDLLSSSLGVSPSAQALHWRYTNTIRQREDSSVLSRLSRNGKTNAASYSIHLSSEHVSWSIFWLVPLVLIGFLLAI